jgi:hypothetical protein
MIWRPRHFSYWQRCIQLAKPGPQARFKETLELFFEAVNQQARDRDAGIIADLESYIDVRRDTSGCKPVFDLIEYALYIDLPEEVITHPIIKALNQGTNDLVTWSNVSLGVDFVAASVHLETETHSTGYLFIQRRAGAR